MELDCRHLDSSVETAVRAYPQPTQASSHCLFRSWSAERSPGDTRPQFAQRYLPSPYTDIDEASTIFWTRLLELSSSCRKTAGPWMLALTYWRISYMAWPSPTAA